MVIGLIQCAVIINYHQWSTLYSHGWIWRPSVMVVFLSLDGIRWKMVWCCRSGCPGNSQRGFHILHLRTSRVTHIKKGKHLPRKFSQWRPGGPRCVRNQLFSTVPNWLPTRLFPNDIVWHTPPPPHSQDNTAKPKFIDQGGSAPKVVSCCLMETERFRIWFWYILILISSINFTVCHRKNLENMINPGFSLYYFVLWPIWDILEPRCESNGWISKMSSSTSTTSPFSSRTVDRNSMKWRPPWQQTSACWRPGKRRWKSVLSKKTGVELLNYTICLYLPTGD